MLPTQLSPQQQITLARIAERHSVLLGSNDPILMVQTMLESAQEDITHSQAARLKQFGEDLETGLHRWEDAAQQHSAKLIEAASKHSEDVINQALAAAQKNLEATLRQTTDETIGRITRESAEVLSALAAARQQQQRAAIACIAGAIGIIGLFVLEALRSGGIL